MLVDGITAKMIELLLKCDKPISTAVIAESIAVSQSSVKSHLKDAKQIIEASNGKLINKQGSGIMLEADLKARGDIRLRLNSNLDQSYFYHFRKKYILDVLFSDFQNYTIQMLADDLYVGKISILKDLERIEQWLDQFDIKIVRKKHTGVAMSGSESNIRQALMEHNRNYGLQEAADETGELVKGLDYRLRQRFYNYLKQQYSEENILDFQNRLLAAEEKLGVIYADSFLGRLLEYLLIAEYRIKNGFQISKKQFSDDLILLPEYTAAAEIMKSFGLKDNSPEIKNLTAYLLAFKTQQGFDSADEHRKENMAASTHFISSVSSMLGVSLVDDQELMGALYCYLKRFRLYKEYGIRIISALNSDIRKNNPRIFTVCDLAVSDIESELGFSLTKNEIAEITLLVSNSIGKNTRPIKAILVTGSDYQTSKYIANRITTFIPQLAFSRIIMYQNDPELALQSGKFIISTLSLPGESAVLISKVVGTADIVRIQKALLERQKKRAASASVSLFEQVFDPRAFDLECSLRKRTDIIRHGCEMLQKLGKVDADFAESALEREVFSPTAIGKSVALPHGKQEQIRESGIAVIRLKKPIEWTDEERVDLVFILALKFEEKWNFSAFFSKFYSLIEDSKALEKLRSCKTEEEALTVLVAHCIKNNEL